MKKNGFTLVELLGVIVLIAILAGLAVISVNSVINSGKKGVYKNYESTLKGAAQNYFIDHPDSVPYSNVPTIHPKIRLTYKDLLDNHYIDELKDPSGGNCENSYVEVKRGTDVGNNMNLSYKTCVICKTDDDKYTNLDDECSDSVAFIITASGTKKGSVTYSFSNLTSPDGEISVVVMNADGSVKSNKTVSNGGSTTITIKNGERATVSNLKKCVYVNRSVNMSCYSDDTSWCDENGNCYFEGSSNDINLIVPPVQPGLECPGFKTNTTELVNFDNYC